MKHIISTLTEKITLMKDSEDKSKTTVKRYEEVMNARASIRSLKSNDNLGNLFEVIILKPPAKFKNTQFSALKWNNLDYAYISQLSDYKEKFLKGTITQIPN